MEADKTKNGLNGKKKFTGLGKEVEAAANKGIREALKMHKALGNPVAVWRDGKVVILQPDEIILK